MAAQVRLLQIEGVKTQGNSKLGWYVLLDKNAVGTATSGNLGGQALADELAKAIRTPQDLQKIDLVRMTRFRSAAYGGATVLGGLLMTLNYTKLLNDVENGMSHEIGEATAKIWMGRMAIEACGRTDRQRAGEAGGDAAAKRNWTVSVNRSQPFEDWWACCWLWSGSCLGAMGYFERC